MEPVVSVIIPNYNHATFLQERLDSILNQTYTKFEVIILDDASQDKSKDIIERYRKHPKVKQLIYNDKNTGNPFLQWKKGLDLAKGKYIWIAESDDSCSCNFLETLTSIFEANNSLSLAYVDSERKLENWKQVKMNSDLNIQVFEGYDFVKQHMLTSPVIVNASAVLFKKRLIKNDIFQFTDKYKTAFDWLFWCDILMQGKVGYYPHKLNLFRQHQQNTSLKNNLKGLFVIEGLQVISYLKQVYNIKLNLTQIKIWASVWAQTSLGICNTKKLFLQVKNKAWHISPKILLYYLYYLLKFRFISNTNIKLK